MVSKKQIIDTMTKLNDLLQKNAVNSDIGNYIQDSLLTLEKSDGVAFTGQFQQFLNHAPIVKMSSSVRFNEEEQKLWDELFSLNELGNNLWGASL